MDNSRVIYRPDMSMLVHQLTLDRRDNDFLEAVTASSSEVAART